MKSRSSGPLSSRQAAAPGVCVGTRAPDFSLSCTARPDAQRDQVSLVDYRDRWLVLLFYPRDFSMVCHEFQEGYPQISQMDADG